jgi:hypothetical protein
LDLEEKCHIKMDRFSEGDKEENGVGVGHNIQEIMVDNFP